MERNQALAAGEARSAPIAALVDLARRTAEAIEAIEPPSKPEPDSAGFAMTILSLEARTGTATTSVQCTAIVALNVIITGSLRSYLTLY